MLRFEETSNPVGNQSALPGYLRALDQTRLVQEGDKFGSLLLLYLPILAHLMHLLVSRGYIQGYCISLPGLGYVSVTNNPKSPHPSWSTHPPVGPARATLMSAAGGKNWEIASTPAHFPEAKAHGLA